MSTILISIDDSVSSELIDAVCASGGFVSSDSNEKSLFAASSIKTFLKSHLLQYRREFDDDLKAARSDFATASAAVSSAIKIASERRIPVPDNFATVTVN